MEKSLVMKDVSVRETSDVSVMVESSKTVAEKSSVTDEVSVK